VKVHTLGVGQAYGEERPLVGVSLQPQPPPSPGESVAHNPDNLLLQLRSRTRRKTTRLNKEQMTATTTLSQGTAWLQQPTIITHTAYTFTGCLGFTEDVGRLHGSDFQRCVAYVEVQRRDKTKFIWRMCLLFKKTSQVDLTVF
jgi:hypothetical protein